MSKALAWGAHAPSRARFGALAETRSLLLEQEERTKKVCDGEAPSPAREARALPRKPPFTPSRNA